MAALCTKQMTLTITSTVCALFMLNVVDSQSMPSISHVQQWATSLSSDLRKAFEVTTGYHLLDLRYNNRSEMYTDPQVFQLRFETVNSSKLVHDMSGKLSTMLKNKMEALNRSVVAAEAAAASYDWNPKITEDDVKIVNVKTLMDNESGLTYHERFRQRVITNVSGVHIPVEIYDQDVKILNGLKWSEALDKIFADNFNRDPEILWQYFGSQTGFMRTLPASRWKFGPNDVDLYDVRRRPWYTQGSSSPKDMLIILDKSGSVYGQALALMKVSVKSLLDTLGENDFVNIATFNDKASFVTSCFNGSFMQANYRNKKIFVDAVDQIVAQGMANFKVGIEFAFQQFIKLENESESQRGAGCNKMIMLLTDGGTDHAEEIFKKYNPKGEKQRVRVFTYAIGPTANPVTSIRWMACANRGYFSQIPAMGAIRTKVQEYLLKPAQAMETYMLSEAESVQFSIQSDTRGLGMMTTVTLPVYNRTSGSLNQTILGVMGIDVTTAEMQKWSPTRKMGPNGFSFAINSNGYIVFHPNLRLQSDLREPPNVDFLEVEVEGPEMEQLRQNMINLNTDSKTMNKYYKIAYDQRHIDIEANRVYSYTGIDRTTFSLGISLPEYQKHYLNIVVNIKEFNKDKQLLNDSYNAVLIADWDYYKNFTARNLTGTIFDLEAALNEPDSYDWNEDLISHLLWDLNITAFFSDYWRLDMDNGFDGLVGRFVGTDGGLTRVHPKREDLVLQFMERRDTWNTDYYKRAIASDLFMFSAPYILEPTTHANETAGNIIVVKSVTLDNDYDSGLSSPLKYRAAVLGALLKRKSLSEKLNATAVGSNGVPDCQDAENLACYLLDDGAFIVGTNQQKYDTSVGRFFGHVDPEIMRELFNKSMYSRLEQFDYQASCVVEKEEEINSASTLSLGLSSLTFLYELLTFNWWTSVITWSFANFNLYNMLYSSSMHQAEAAYIHDDTTRPCIMKQAQYYYNTEMASLAATTDCEIRTINCSRSYRAVRLNDTNLLLVVTEVEQMDCERCRLYIPPDDRIQEPTESEPDFCSITPRYRKPTDNCFDYDAREDDTECAASLTHPVSRGVILLITMVTTWCIQR